jgi:hypothetical protein
LTAVLDAIATVSISTVEFPGIVTVTISTAKLMAIIALAICARS